MRTILTRKLINKRLFGIINEHDLWKTIGKLDGQINPDELFELFSRVSSLPDHATVVEIGSYRGKSTVALGLAAKKINSRVYCIDPHDEFTGVAGGIFGPQDLAVKLEVINRFNLGDVIFPVCLGSEIIGEIWDKNIDLLWIDGDHRYEAVKKDFDLFSSHIKPGGYLIFHDSDMDGVARCISEMDKKVYTEEKTVRSMKIFRKN